jgi:hypothetical protein
MEMWRGSQQWVWLVPNNLVACWKAFSTELAFFKLFKLGKVRPLPRFPRFCSWF